jgi:hypothetical protein
MPRFRTPELFLGAFLAISIFAMGMLFSSQYISSSGPSPRQHASQSKSANSPEQHEESGWAWVTKDAAGFFTLFLVIVGGIQAGLFWVQLKAIREALKPTQEAAEAANATATTARAEFQSTHRPKIRIKHLLLASDVWGDEKIIVNLTCVNTGTAEAVMHEVGLRYEVVRTDRLIPIDPKIRALRRYQGGRLECGRNWTVENIDANFSLSNEQNTQIQNGQSKLYCVGYVSYVDSADRMRITGFCRVLTFPPDAVAHVGNTRFRKFDDPDYEYED